MLSKVLPMKLDGEWSLLKNLFSCFEYRWACACVCDCDWGWEFQRWKCIFNLEILTWAKFHLIFYQRFLLIINIQFASEAICVRCLQNLEDVFIYSAILYSFWLVRSDGRLIYPFQLTLLCTGTVHKVLIWYLLAFAHGSAVLFQLFQFNCL